MLLSKNGRCGRVYNIPNRFIVSTVLLLSVLPTCFFEGGKFFPSNSYVVKIASHNKPDILGPIIMKGSII